MSRDWSGADGAAATTGEKTYDFTNFTNWLKGVQEYYFLRTKKLRISRDWEVADGPAATTEEKTTDFTDFTNLLKGVLEYKFKEQKPRISRIIPEGLIVRTKTTD